MTPPAPCLRFGPFELYEPVGRGASATVYRGLHIEQDIPVAVKVIKRRPQKENVSSDPLGREVRAVAFWTPPAGGQVEQKGRDLRRVHKGIIARLDLARPASMLLSRSARPCQGWPK